MTEYKAIFDGVEETLVRVGSQNVPPEKIRQRLNEFKFGKRTLSDDEYYRTLVFIIFASGFRAATAEERKPAIERHFPGYQVVAGYGASEVRRIMSDPVMIKNQRKIDGCVDNARQFQKLVAKYGSFQRYVESFEPEECYENLMLLKEDLDCRFKGLGGVTSYHFLTEMGMPVIKPDRVICRIFARLGLIEDENHILHAVFEARKFAEATGHPFRYIDIVFVTYGQMRSKDLGSKRGICLEKNPACGICGVQQYCSYPTQSKARKVD